MEEKKPDIEKILAERVKLDSMLQSEFSRDVTVMFTDIKGSTSFYDIRGDIDGRVLVHRHNEIVMPALKENQCVLSRTIGDGTLSVYDNPEKALNAAIKIQAGFRAYNNNRSDKEQIHVSVGLNYGNGILEEHDVYGDVVNVASRVESLAGPDDIFVTEGLYREVKNHDEFIFRYVDSMKVKGKSQSLKVYRVVWREEDLCLGKTRKADDLSRRKEGVFVLEASVSGKDLKISASERTDGEEKPAKSYKEIKFNDVKIRDYVRGIKDLLNRANRRGKIDNELLVRLREYGSLLLDELIPPDIKERLIRTDERHLMISIDDNLVHIPWELLFDGKDFLCQRFNMGRSVSTKQYVSVVSRAVSRPLKMQILADPRGDLNASYEEGVGIKNEVSRFEGYLNVSLKTTDIKTDYVKAKIRNFDLVHYAGHADHDSTRPEESGWLLKDGKLSSEDIVNMTGAMPMPSLVFSNACHTGHTEQWKLEDDYENRIFGLANAFLLSGVQHYIGTFWEIPDEAGRHFAMSFYNDIVKGATVGEALTKARHALIDKYGEDTIVWASYMLYGDPTTRYIDHDLEIKKPEPDEKPDKEVLASTELRHSDAKVQLTGKKKSKTGLIMAGFAVIIVAVVLIILMNRSEKAPAPVTAERNLSAAEKEESGKKIDELVAGLSARYREGKFEQAKGEVDWSKKPLTMVFLDIRPKDNPATEKFINLVSQSIQTEEKIRIVERQLLTKLLEELKLSSSALADPLTSLKLGKVLSAKIIVTGSITPDNRGQSVMLKLIDTETTEIKKMISAETMENGIDRELIRNISGQITAWAKTAFPLK